MKVGVKWVIRSDLELKNLPLLAGLELAASLCAFKAPSRTMYEQLKSEKNHPKRKLQHASNPINHTQKSHVNRKLWSPKVSLQNYSGCRPTATQKSTKNQELFQKSQKNYMLNKTWFALSPQNFTKNYSIVTKIYSSKPHNLDGLVAAKTADLLSPKKSQNTQN